MGRPRRASSLFCWVSVIAGLSLWASVAAWCAEPPTVPVNSDRMDVTIVHVDKYAIYAPDLVFYWDSKMSKKQIGALTSAAQRLRGKKAVITFAPPEDPSKDNRNILLDISPYKDEPEEPPFVESARVESVPTETWVEDGYERYDPRSLKEDGYQRYDPRERAYQDAVESAPSARPVPALPPISRMAPSNETPSREERTVGTLSAIDREELTYFVKSVLRSSESKDMVNLLRHYASRVDYYNRGEVDQNYIRKDLGYYFRNWDIVESSLDGRVVMIVTDQPDVRIAKFMSTFYVQNAKKTIRGRTENIWRIQLINGSLKIVDQKQKILESETR